MRSQALEHCVFGLAVVTTLLWLDLVPAALLRDALFFVLAWAAFSTLLVASAGAWIAFARARAREGAPPRPRQLTHPS